RYGIKPYRYKRAASHQADHTRAALLWTKLSGRSTWSCRQLCVPISTKPPKGSFGKRLQGRKKRRNGLDSQLSRPSLGRRWTRPKPGPDIPPLKFLIRLDVLFEAKRKLRRPVLFQISDSLLRLIDAWNVSRRNPPQRSIYAYEFLEPLMPLTQ